MLCRLECNKQIIKYDNKQTSQPASICRLLPTTDNYDKSCTAAVMLNLEIDEDFTLPSQNSPLYSKSINLIPNGGGDVVVRQKMANSDKHHVTGSRTIIDDIVGWSTSKALVMLLFECMCCVSTKYRASFKLSKCEFFYDRFEYVGHDLMVSGNTTAQSKYDLINH